MHTASDRSDVPLSLEKRPQSLNHLPKTVCSTLDNTLPDPRRELALDPWRPVSPVQQQDARVVSPVPDRSPDALVHRSHARVLVELPRRSFPLVPTACPRRRALLDVLQLGFPLGALDVGEREADDHDAAPERVGEVDAFGHLAADDGEEEAAVAGGDGLGVSVEDVVGAGGGF